MSLYTFLWKYTAYDIIEMVNECAAPKCQTGNTSSTGKLSSFPSEKWGFEQKMDSFCQQERLGSYKALSFMRVAFGRYLQKIYENAWV